MPNIDDNILREYDGSIKKIVEQLELCEYTDKHGHPLDNNVAFIALKNLAKIE